MDTTPNLELPYPQCEPPLVRDASDIEQFRDLAEAADREVQELNDAITDRLIRPDACRLLNNVAFVSTLAENVVPMDAISFDNQPGNAMSDLVNGGIRIVTTGWYLVGAGVVSTVATDVQTRARFLVNGDPVTNFQGPSGLVTAGQQNLAIEDQVPMVAGDLLTLQTRNGAPGTSVSYAAVLWTVLAAPNV